ncbi:MAG: putative gluconate dehydrogenase [Candidatus Brocadia fulgida]|uniref:Gluconate dehydrogenase n=1 Tax=Candidatus Brocadia fulgida TaxID=380242 RepID=A0A0M2UYR9_9BACT|nr:MAG: putative gluconate dehydrogenase [Candidatus Brocadia fulgida]
MCVELFSLRDKVALVTGAGKGHGKIDGPGAL